MPKKTPIRIAISNVLTGNDYTGRLYVGSQRKPVDVTLDKGSSTLAVDRKKYDPLKDGGAVVTSLVQEVKYEDESSWIGSVVQTDVAVTAGARTIDLPAVPVAVAYHEKQMFGDTGGILGLAFEAKNDAVDMRKPTVPPRYSPNDLRGGHRVMVDPYFTALESSGLVADKFAFSTHRSAVRASRAPTADPLNQGVLILGGGEEATDLYTGRFQTATVLTDDYWSVNLKQVIVGDTAPIEVTPPAWNSGDSTNAIVDSGTNGLDLAPRLFDEILARMSSDQVRKMRSRNSESRTIDLVEWPAITFVLSGMTADVRLTVGPEHYWQMDGYEVGSAYRSLWRGDGQQSTLGLPLMNAYYTVFDGAANRGLGVVKFAKHRT